MKYFSISSVVEAYNKVSSSTKEKFWGIMGILHSIEESVCPNKSYSVETWKLSQYFEDLFRLHEKRGYSGTDEYSFVFSTHWVDVISEDYLVGKPGITPILVWAYRNHSFTNEISVSELFKLFLEDYHISKEVAERLFKISFTEQLKFEDNCYFDSDLLLQLGGSVASGSTTLKLNGTFAVANAGDLSRGPYFQPLYASLQTLKCLTIYPFNIHDYYNLKDYSKPEGDGVSEVEIGFATNQIVFYGAPGTGKSHRIKDDAGVKTADEKNLVFRTTFHPDSDYSTFMGAYKPTMRPVADKYKAVAGKDEEITYSFVPQAFLQAYVAAWNNQDENVYLIIEEINRGNCAQIFGDLFQLLDRDCDGYSEYPIMADKDLSKYLNGKDENGRDVLTNKDGIKDGKLRLPKNLYIWATMNTSDQSLFPIDSAFKRRWDWKYIPIEDAGKNWKIKIKSNEYDWYQFLDAINKEVFSLTHSEDKQLGYFFAKAKNGIIDAETLVNKVFFYLWTDVFKDYDYESQKAFRKPESNDAISFKDFFANGSVNEAMAEHVLVNLGLEKTEETDE